MKNLTVIFSTPLGHILWHEQILNFEYLPIYSNKFLSFVQMVEYFVEIHVPFQIYNMKLETLCHDSFIVTFGTAMFVFLLTTKQSQIQHGAIGDYTFPLPVLKKKKHLQFYIYFLYFCYTASKYTTKKLTYALSFVVVVLNTLFSSSSTHHFTSSRTSQPP